MMNNTAERDKYPGINQFLNAVNLHQRMESYRQIPPWEMENLWSLVALHGTLEHLEYIYHKKLANTTFYESMINFWYASDLNSWEDNIGYVFASNDIEKIKFIVSKGACKSITSDGNDTSMVKGHLEIILKSSNSNITICFFREWIQVASEIDKTIFHETIKEFITNNAPQISENLSGIFKIPLVIENFLTLERFKDYLIISIKNNLIESFTVIYNVLPNIIIKASTTNNYIFNLILLYADNITFCNQALAMMSHQDNESQNGSINPLLKGMLLVKSKENQTIIMDFLNKYHGELTMGTMPWYHPRKKMLELISSPILRQCFFTQEIQTGPKIPAFIYGQDSLDIEVIKDIIKNESIENIGKLLSVLNLLTPKLQFVDVLVTHWSNNEDFKQKLEFGIQSLFLAHLRVIEDALQNILLRNMREYRNERQKINLEIQDLLQEIYKTTQSKSILTDVFWVLYEHGTDADIELFLRKDNNLLFFYELVKDKQFLTTLRDCHNRQRLVDSGMYVEKLKRLDFPFQVMDNFREEIKEGYYDKKYKEISKYIEEYSKINHHEIWSSGDLDFMTQMSKKKQRGTPLTADEQTNFDRLKELKAKPYLKYVDKGVTFSLAKGLSTSGNNPTKQMILDTLVYYLIKQEQIIQNLSNRFWVSSSVNRQEFVHNLLSCPPIAAVLKFSFETNQNKLLSTLERSPNMQGYIGAFLDNREFYEKGMLNNFDFKTPYAENNTDSHASLDPKQVEMMNRLKKRYVFPKGFDGFVKRKELKDILIERYHKNPLIVGGKIMPLEYSYSLTHDEITACYKHNLHTAIRYLSVPNTWLTTQYGFMDSYRKCAILEETQIEALWIFWIAASDTSEEMSPREIIRVGNRDVQLTVDDRIQTYIDAIAQPARAHNFKTKLALGLAKRGDRDATHEVDDLQKDNPSCPDGATKRIYSSLLDHPLAVDINFVYARDMIRELKGMMFNHIYQQINLQNYQEIFDALQSQDKSYLDFLRQFNLPRAEVETFKNNLKIKMERKFLPWIYNHLIDHCYTQNSCCHVLTCESEIANLANNKVVLIQKIIDEQVNVHLTPRLKQLWQEKLNNKTEDNHISVHYREKLRKMNFCEQLELFVESCNDNQNHQEDFNRSFNNCTIPDGFFTELIAYVGKYSKYDDVKSLLMAYFPKDVYLPFDAVESSRLELIIELEVMLHKLDGFAEETGLQDSLSQIQESIVKKLIPLNPNPNLVQEFDASDTKRANVC